MATGFSKTLSDSTPAIPDIIELCTGRIRDGRNFYALIQMNAAAYGHYREALSGGRPLDLNAYGKILHSGWGDTPDAATLSRLMRDYTDNFKIMEALGQDAASMTGTANKNQNQNEKWSDLS